MCRHRQWIQVALRHAHKSEVPHYKHASVLVKGGKIIAVGINKNKCGCLGDPLYGLKGWHSELDVLFDLDPERVRGATLYVAGWSKGKNVVRSKPCRYCQEFIKRFDLKEVYYSVNDKNIFERMA